MSRRNSIAVFVLLLLAALVLQLVELPAAIAPGRPLWLPILFAYWTYAAPKQASFLVAWLAGLALDVLFDAALGQHALGLVVVMYLVQRLRKFLVVLPFWQTALVLAPVWAIYSFLLFWIDGVRSQQADVWMRWLPVATSTLMWPLLFPVLSSLGKPSRE